MTTSSDQVKTGRILTESARQQARYNLLSPKDVADRISDEHVDDDTVRSWCDAGWLRWVDGRRAGATRPMYLIAWEWVEEFIANGGAAAFPQPEPSAKKSSAA